MHEQPTVPDWLRPYLIAPLILLGAAIPPFRALGALGVRPLATWRGAVRHALALLFAFTAVSHFGRQRPGLITMVPPQLPYPEHLVSLTGALEVAGAVGLLAPATATPAGRALAALLLALFPANVRAARAGVAIGEKPATPLPFRTLVQALFVGLLLWSTGAGTARD